MADTPEGLDDGTADVEATSGEGTDDRPPWLPDKFQSPEALANSYHEAERRIAEQGRELNELKGEFEEITATLTAREQAEQQSAGMSQQEAQLLNALARAREDGDMQQELAIVSHVANLQAEARYAELTRTQAPPQQDPALVMHAAEQSLRERYPDYDQFREAAGQQITRNPGLLTDMTLQGVQQGIDAAYRLAKADTLMEAQNSQQQKAAAQQEADRQAKLDAQTLTGSGTRQAPPSEAADTWARIVAAGSGRASSILTPGNQ